MKNPIHPKKHKAISVAVLTVISFVGLQAAAYLLQKNQDGLFWKSAGYLYSFLIFWIVFSYDTHRRHIAAAPVIWSQLSNYLILPSVIYWSAAGLMFLSPFSSGLQTVWTILAAAGLGTGIWYLKVAFHEHRQANRNARQLVFLAKILASYLGFTAAVGLGRHYGFGGLWSGLLVLLISQLLLRQAMFQHHHMRHDSLKLVLLLSLGLGVAGYLLYHFWNVNFYSAGLVLSALYNTSWGLIQHRFIDRNLTRKIAYEYLAVLFVILVVLFSTTNFAEKI